MSQAMKAKAKKATAETPPSLYEVRKTCGTVRSINPKGKWTHEAAEKYLRRKKIQVVGEGFHTVRIAINHYVKTSTVVLGPGIVIDAAAEEEIIGINTWGCIDFMRNFYGYNVYRIINQSAKK